MAPNDVQKRAYGNAAEARGKTSGSDGQVGANAAKDKDAKGTEQGIIQ